MHLSHLGKLGVPGTKQPMLQSQTGSNQPLQKATVLSCKYVNSTICQKPARGGQGRGADVAVLTHFSKEKCNLAKRGKGFSRVQEVKQM